MPDGALGQRAPVVLKEMRTARVSVHHALPSLSSSRVQPCVVSPPLMNTMDPRRSMSSYGREGRRGRPRKALSLGPPVKRGGMTAFFNCVPSSSNTSATLTAGPALAGRTVPGYASDAVGRVVVEDGLARMEPRDSGLHTNVLLGTVANAQQQDCTLVDPSGGTLGTAIALAFSALPSVVTWNIPACIAPIVVDDDVVDIAKLRQKWSVQVGHSSRLAPGEMRTLPDQLITQLEAMIAEHRSIQADLDSRSKARIERAMRLRSTLQWNSAEKLLIMKVLDCLSGHVYSYLLL